MSLAFLAKKSWHTTNISNQEKVWLRQQEKEQEKKKTELLQKQMKEEREIEEMRQASGQGRTAVRHAVRMHPVLEANWPIGARPQGARLGAGLGPWAMFRMRRACGARPRVRSPAECLRQDLSRPARSPSSMAFPC